MEQRRKRIAVLGSTGSIGTQTLDVIRQNPDKFCVEVLAAHSNDVLLVRQAREFEPNAVVIADATKYQAVKDALSGTDIKVFAGERSVEQIVEMETIDVVLAAIVGYAGLASTLNAIKHGKAVALANKETLVVAGELVTRAAKQARVPLLPVDSEHSAIFQCLVGETGNPVEKLILTASGGPFRGRDRAYLEGVTREMALKHPNWSMGAKITIDSATLMNKGLEVIEAHWLFGVPANAIDVVVHPQSIVHSLVQFTDGSIKAQLGLPDMKLPIQYALGFPARIPNSYERFDFLKYPQLTFAPPDRQAFACLDLAYSALKKGGNAPCVLNSANEIAVDAFLNGKAGFLEIGEIVAETLQKVPFVASPDYAQFVECDREARLTAAGIVNSK